MELPDGFPDGLVPAAAAFLPDPHLTGAPPRAPRVSDASDAVRPDEAADAACFLLALAAAPSAEKLVVPAQDVRAPTAEALRPQVLPAQL
jgi:hypothetical protein